MEKIDVVVVDDHPLIHEAVRSLLIKQSDMRLVGEGYCGEDLFPLLEEHRPDVLILDLMMPRTASDQDGSFAYMEALAKIRRDYPDTILLIVSLYVQRGLARHAREYGIKGYLLKSDNLSLHLDHAIRAVSQGGVFYSQEFGEVLFDSQEDPGGNLVTRQQRRVLLAVAKNPEAPYAVLAEQMGLAEGTFKNHLRIVFRKLGASTKLGCVLQALERGLLPFRSTADGKGIIICDSGPVSKSTDTHVLVE